MRKIIHIYHTNDLHSHLENWPRIVRFLQERRRLHEQAGEHVFVFDLGDHADRSHPMTEGSLGKRNVDLLNEVGCDAATIGNNEGITLPKDGLDHLYDHASFPIVLANLFHPNGERPKWALPSIVLTLAHDVKIGLTGATAFFSSAYEQLGWKLTPPVEELQKQSAKLKEQADILVILSHLGIYDDERIGREISDADVVLGAHTHHLLHEGKEVNGTLLAAAGKFGYYVGHVTIEWDTEQKQVVHKQARVYKTSEDLEAPLNEQQQIQEYLDEGKQALNQPVVRLEESLTSEWFAPSPLPTLLCEGLREWCGADCAMLNAGVVLEGLQAGTVTKYDIHRVLPHPINPCLVELQGDELKEVLKQTLDDRLTHLAIKGLGFRGKVMGQFVYDRVDLDMESYSVKIDGQEIDPDKVYKLATLDMFAYGQFFPEIYRAPKKTHFMPEFLRDVMEWKLLHLRS